MQVYDERAALVALLYGGPFMRTPRHLRLLLTEGRLPSDIAREASLSPVAIEEAEMLISKWKEDGEKLLTWLDDEYPQQFRDVHDFPPIVFTRGRLVPDDFGVCVVGSRKASSETINSVREIASILVEKKATVVSGLALGVDSAAHETALQEGGRTVAVIGNGIDVFYPRVNAGLQRKIESKGLVISQFWPGSRPVKVSFPMRNAVMSAYAQATIIVSAEENSGTRHQARQAVAHGRPLVLSASVANRTSWGSRIASDPTAMVAVAVSASDAVNYAIKMADRLNSLIA